jgi:hypothetical protein
MANEQNLKILSPNEAREFGRMGGIVSGKMRQERKKVQQIAKAIASMPARDLLPTHRLNVVDDKGSSLDEASVMEAIISKLANDALRGKVTAIKLFLEIAGVMPQLQSINMIACETKDSDMRVVYGHTKQGLPDD